MFFLSFFLPASNIRSHLRPYLEALQRMYATLYRLHPEISWIVDSSKTPVYGWILSLMDNADVRFIHLIRDPIETEASVWKRKLKAHPWYRGVQPGQTVMRWTLWTWLHHLKLHRHPHYRLLTYRHLLENPREVVAWLHRWLGLEPYLDAFRSDNVVFLQPTHTFGGSPSRLRTGEVSIQPTPLPDLSPIHRLWASLLAFPGHLLYKRARCQPLGLEQSSLSSKGRSS